MRTLRSSLAVLTLGAVLSAPASAQVLPSPEAHFGFAMGAAKQLARWDEILEYFTILADGSDRMRVDTIGPSTLGNPYVVVTFTSPANMARLDEIRDGSRTLAEARISREEAEALAADLPVTTVIHHNIHSTEIGASQTSVDMAYRLAAAQDAETLEILDNVVTVLIPSGNPDGQIMVTDWYRRNVGTDFEEARMPYLYHHYAGHDNNRDYFQANLVETRHWMEVMFHTAYPQLYLDQHQMGSTGPRIFVPPYPDPMDPDIHPLQWQSLQFLGGGIVADLQRAGKKGVITGEMYRIWGQEGALTGRHHNIVGLLTETASANIASPVTVTREQLEQGARRLGPGARYGFQMSFADPWWGGEWTLGDIVDYQTVAAFSFLKQAARFREQYVMGRYQMASETVEEVRAEGPFAWVIPADQTDPVTAWDMARRLALQGIQVHRAEEPFTAVPEARTLRPQTGDPEDLAEWADHDEDEYHGEEVGEEGEREEEHADEGDEDEHQAPAPRTFSAGSWVVFAAQPAWAAAEDLLMPQAKELAYEYPGGPFRRSYDAAAYTMPMQMGVETALVWEPFDAELTRVDPHAAPMSAPLPEADRWWMLSRDVNQSYNVANRLLAEGIPVSWDDGGFWVPARHLQARDALQRLVDVTGVSVTADPQTEGPGALMPLARSRVGLYQGWASSMDEGWTRLLLEEYGFDLTVLGNDDVRAGDLAQRLDVVIIPSEISLTRLLEGASEEDAPEGFRGGIGEEGVESLKAFVRDGGTLVTLDRGDAVVLEHFGVPVRDALEDVSNREIFTPASLYRLELDPDHPMAIGSPEAVAAKWAGGRAYEPSDFGENGVTVDAVGRWAEDPDELLMSGLVAGAEHIAGKAAILDVSYGSGKILMYGFRVQHRGQTAGTFKLLFNAMFKAGPRTATE